VIVTRPHAQSAALAAMIAGAGGTVIGLPLLAIEGLPATPAACAVLAPAPDIAIFVSANAAEHGLRIARECGAAIGPSTQVAAVGAATARALEALGVARVALPASRFDSEGLLATTLLRDVRGKRVLIARGVDGRETLADELRARGASVDYLPCYRRVPVPLDARALTDALAGPAHDTAWVITSAEALRHLVAAAAPMHGSRLTDCAFVLIGERLARTAAELGLAGPVFIAPQMSDAGLLAALGQWRRGATKVPDPAAT